MTAASEIWSGSSFYDTARVMYYFISLCNVLFLFRAPYGGHGPVEGVVRVLRVRSRVEAAEPPLPYLQLMCYIYVVGISKKAFENQQTSIQ